MERNSGFYVAFTTKFSCWPSQPMEGILPVINYRWNIQDPVTGFNYSDNLMPATALMNRTYFTSAANGGPMGTPSPYDGDWHEFDAPWRFDKAYLLNIMFRPITDIVQYDSSVNIGPGGLSLITYEDRVSGQRDQSVYIQAEFQGERIGGR